MKYALLVVLWKKRDLCKTLLKRDIDARYRGSFLGYLWLALIPLALLLIYTFVFGVVFRLRWPDSGDSLANFSLFLFVGLIAHGWLADTTNRATGLIVENATYVKKVAFPLELLSVVSVLSAGVHFLASLVVCLAVISYFRGVYWTWGLFPLIFLPFFLLLLGTSWLLAALGVFFRDIRHALPLILMCFLYLSPVFYPVSAVPEKWAEFLYLNPMTLIIEMMRSIALGGQIPSIQAFAMLWGMSLLFFFGGLWLFSRLREHYADLV